MGAWIETKKYIESPLRGYVAPYVGAWIETNHHGHHQNQIGVAPYVGAWIETCIKIGSPVKVCGLGIDLH